MKSKFFIRALILALIITTMFSISGCNKSGSTIDEPDEISVEYLTGEYADQLIRDGAQVTTGTVTIDQPESAGYEITIHSMCIVDSDMSDAGYYVADTNLSTVMPLDPSVRITYEGEVIAIEDFAAIVNAEDFDPLAEGDEKLFDVYSIGETALLILETEMPATEE